MKNVIILAGLPGAGKSNLATRLADRSSYLILSRDTIKRALFGKWDVGQVQNDYAFSTLLEVLPIALTLAPGIVVDGLPFSRLGQAELVEEVVKECGALSKVIFLDCDVRTAAARLSHADPRGPDNRTPALVSRVAKEFREIPEHWIRVDSNKSPLEIEGFVLGILQQVTEEQWTYF